MGATRDQHLALSLEYDGVVRFDTPVFEAHDSRVITLRVAVRFYEDQ
jgi:hypothetical protein